MKCNNIFLTPAWCSIGFIFGSIAVLPMTECFETHRIHLVSRSDWNAREAASKSSLSTPVPYVVIHHTYIPKACDTRQACCQAMRSMQNFHMDDRGWSDIGYNFAVGGDGAVYEGRGFRTLGAHSLHFNQVSIGISLIGDWTVNLPPENQMKSAKELIALGVKKGFIKPNYKLVGHRQVRDTECPGEALFNEVKTWKHWSKHPASAEELIEVEELPEYIKDILQNNISIVKQ